VVDKIVVFDFAGTLIRADIIEEANNFRSKVLDRSLPARKEHSKPEELYKANNEFVQKLTGLRKDMKINYRENNLEFMNINGGTYQNQVSTNLFQIGMWMAAKKHGKDIMPTGMIEQLQRIKKLGYKLAIVSGIRNDTISGMLQIAGIAVDFDYIYAQPPVLGVSNEENLKELKTKGKLMFVLGDKLNDLEAAKKLGAKTIFVTWGHASGGEKEFADYTIDGPKDFERIIK
jgi:phosphoglycolate phosphatase-like HAD superfamily hydrolase